VTDRPPRHFLLFAYYYPPWNTSGVQRATRIAKYLPESGYVPHVICSSAEGIPENAPGVHHVPNPATEAEAGRASRWAERFQRAVLPYNEQLPWVPHALAAAETILRDVPISAVISTSPPVVTHVAAMRIRQRHQIPWLADFRDPLLGNPGRPRKWAKPYDAALQAAFLGASDGAMAVTDVIVDEWKRKYPRWARKFHIVWNGFDPEEPVSPLPIPPREFKLLVHAGVVYRQRHPFWLAASLDRLMERGALDPARVRVRLVGALQDREVFCAHPAVASLLARGCLECDGQTVPREAAMNEVASADGVLILDIANLSEIGYTVPAKLYDNIRVGRPILAYTPSAKSPSARILRQSGVPHTAIHAEDSDETIDRKLLGFFQLPNDPVEASPWFDENFDGRRQAKLIAGILDKLSLSA
jgi:hypothetical protein